MELRRLPNRDLIRHLVDAGPDDPLWLEFISRFQPRLRVIVFRSFQSEAERYPTLDAGPAAEAVEDLTQEVLVRLLEGGRRALSSFRGRSEQSIYTYLSAIAVNLVRDHFKKLRAQKTPKGSTSLENAVDKEYETGGPASKHSLSSDGPGPERYLAQRELRERISDALDRVSPGAATTPRDRLVFRLHFVEGLTVHEVARGRSVGLSASGVEKCIRRMKTLLKEHLGDEGGR